MQADFLEPHSNSDTSMRHTMWLLNLVGAVIYVVLASRGWRILNEHGQIPVAGEPFVWALALPVFGVFSSVNLAWAAVIIRRRQWNAAKFWVLTALIWLAALGIDFTHH